MDLDAIQKRYEDGAMNMDCEFEGGEVNGPDTNRVLRQQNVELRKLVERLKMEAQSHAMEARGANHTIAQIYQLVTQARGEPGNWNGAVPVADELGRLRAAAKRAKGALMWIINYDSEDKVLAKAIQEIDAALANQQRTSDR